MTKFVGPGPVIGEADAEKLTWIEQKGWSAIWEGVDHISSYYGVSVGIGMIQSQEIYLACR